jgi:hypothetical protein
VKATPTRPVLTVVHPDDIPDHRHGLRWRWFQVREAGGTVRWHILTAVAAVAARAVPRVRGQAWREGFDTGLCRPSSPTWRQHLDDWHEGNQVAHEIGYRRHGQAWDGRKFSLRRPFLVPDPPGLAAVAAAVAAEDLEYSGAARAEAAWRQRATAVATAGARWRAVIGALYGAGPGNAADLDGRHGRFRSAGRRAVAAAAVMATAAVAADNHPRDVGKRRGHYRSYLPRRRSACGLPRAGTWWGRGQRRATATDRACDTRRGGARLQQP